MDALERAGFIAHAHTSQFKRRIAEANDYIAQALAIPGQAFVACSWGKDSIVLVNMVLAQAPTIPVIHVRDRYADLITNFGEVRDEYRRRFAISDYYEVIVEMGGASVTHATNDFTADMAWRIRFLGMRLEERGARVYSLRQYGAIHQYENAEWRICPLLNWSWRDVWAYIVSKQLPYPDIYDLPGQEPRSHSRTSSVYSERIISGDGHGALNMGRIALLRQLSPRYFALLSEKFPHLARQI